MTQLAIILENERDGHGRYRGTLVIDDQAHALAEHAGSVWVDLEDLEERMLNVHRGRASITYLYNEAEQATLQSMLAAHLAENYERTLLALRDQLGERGADRLLSKLGLLGVDPADLG